MQRALQSRLPPEAVKALDKVRGARPKNGLPNGKANGDEKSGSESGAADGEDTRGAAVTMRPDAAPDSESKPEAANEEETLEVVFGADDEDAGAAAEGEDEVALTEEEVSALDEKARKKFTDLNKENAKVRKRAQEAERELEEAKARLAEFEAERSQRDAELPEAVGAQNGNSLWRVNDARVLDSLEQDARAVLAKLGRLAKPDQYPEEEATYVSKTDGKAYEIDAAYAQWAAGTLEDVRDRRAQLERSKTSEGRAEKIVKRMEKAPEYSEALKGLKGGDLVENWPEVRALAALGKLVSGGQYKLVKISKTSEAAGARNPAGSHGTDARSTNGAKATAATSKPAPKELPKRMPRGVPEGEGVSPRLSALQERATKTGSTDDIKALMKAKRDARLAGQAA